MFSGAPSARLRSKLGAMAMLVCAGAALSSCNSTGLGLSNEPPPPVAAPVPSVQSQPLGSQPASANLGAPVGQTIGSGPVRVGLILPLTQNNAPSLIGQALSNAARLALDDAGADQITLMLLDDRSTPEGAAQAAQAEVAAGAELILGPLFAPDVREVARVAKGANRPVIAFSTDASAASQGVYLLSFLIESYVDRILDFSMSKGKKSFVALAPQSEYANVAVAEFESRAAKLNARVLKILRYPSGQPAQALQELADVKEPIDALFIPEQAEGMSAVASALASAGVKPQVLGTGVWNDPRVAALPALQGAWYAAPESAGFAAFAKRYRAKFNNDPPRLATLSYDAVSLVAALARTQGSQRFGAAVLTNASGFNGADGVFRFRADGPNDRGLAVMQISNGSATVISPAPHSFAGG